MSSLARRLAHDPAAIGKLEEMKQNADGIIQSIERISVGLRPGILDLLGLEAAIRWQSQEFARQTGIACELHARLADFKLDQDVATAVFRIFQEALTNITRHARASRVAVDLGLEGSVVVLEVADDGVGLPPPGSRGRSLGLLGMGERPAAGRPVRRQPARPNRHPGLAAGSVEPGTGCPAGRKGVAHVSSGRQTRLPK